MVDKELYETLFQGLKTETDIFILYDNKGREATDNNIKAFFQLLSSDLQNHISLIKHIIENLPINNKSPLLPANSNDITYELQESHLFKEANHKLKSVKKTKEELYSNVIHDLRSPLISIVGFGRRLLYSLKDKISDNELQQLQLIFDESRRLEDLVNDFLDFSRFESGKIVPHFSEINLFELVCDVIKILTVQAEEKIGRIINKLPETFPLIFADKNMFVRMFMNLIGNAIHHGGEGNEVYIEGEHEGEYVKVTVEDMGPGINKEDLPRLFEMFYRPPQSQNIIGSGLGLAIVKKIVDTHGGSIWAENKTTGGSIFRIVIPLRTP